MRTPLFTILLALPTMAGLSACSDGKTEDADGDGQSSPLDCDDDDPDIHQGAPDITCDGIDANCDGVVDEGLTTRYYTDADGDGAGDGNAPIDACEQH